MGYFLLSGTSFSLGLFVLFGPGVLDQAIILFCCLFQSGQFNEDMIPTVGFNMRKVTKGNVTIKVSHQYRRFHNIAGFYTTRQHTGHNFS